jgi:hypothetical protein
MGHLGYPNEKEPIMTGQKTTQLDYRRETLRTRAARSAASKAKVTSLDEQLEMNSAARREHEANLQAALDTVAGLKKAIKKADKQRAKLRAARKNARRADAKARQRASTAEAKYDRALLADLVRREKDRDMSQHTEPALPATEAPPVPVTPPPARAGALPQSQPTAALADPPPPPAENGTPTATRTRATRARANASSSTSAARPRSSNG